MNEILSYEEFRNKSEEEQRELMIKWREIYKIYEIQDKMGLSNGAFYRIVHRLNVPKKEVRIEKFERSVLTTKERVYYSKFKDRLYELRKSKNLTQGELGRELGITGNTIGMYEQGKNMPIYEILIKLADFFKVSIDYLLRGKESTSEIDTRYSNIDMNDFKDDGKEEILINVLKQVNDIEKQISDIGKIIKENL